MGQKGKSNTNKTNNATRGNKPEDNGEKTKTKKISTKNTVKTGYFKTTKKFYQQIGGECKDDKETKQFLSKMWQSRKHNRKAEWINNIGKNLARLEEGPIDSLRATLKKVLNWKTPVHDGILV